MITNLLQRNQIILSGEKKTIDEISNIFKNKKIKSIILPVSAPFHCSLMKSAAEKMKDKILKTNFQNPEKELISNVTAKPISDSSTIKKLLIDQICSRVRWRESLLYMVENGTKEFIEIGPGKVLSGLAKRISRNIKVKSINTIEDIKSLK